MFVAGPGKYVNQWPLVLGLEVLEVWTYLWRPGSYRAINFGQSRRKYTRPYTQYTSDKTVAESNLGPSELNQSLPWHHTNPRKSRHEPGRIF